jgi:predicted NAD/FAD-dependent oxidoreductase
MLESGMWKITTEDGRDFLTRAVALTAPVPQSLALLESGSVPLYETDREKLAAMDFDPCLCGLFWIVGDIYLPEPGALQNPDAAITWIADNERKGISPTVRLITVQADSAYSQRYYKRDDAAVLDRLRAELWPFLASSTVILEARLVRWRYAMPKIIHDQRYYRLQGLPTCLIGGDAFRGPRVEGAYLSGMAIGDALVAEISH